MNIREKPDGTIIASCFIMVLLITSILSRYSYKTAVPYDQSFSVSGVRHRRHWVHGT